MKRKLILLTSVSLAVMLLGGTSALAETEAETDTPPAANTLFEATYEGPSMEDETAYIRYHVCKINAEEDAEHACGDEPELSEVAIEPNEEGEINHGTVVSAFVQHLQANGYKGVGCLVRYVAQSDWGKADVEDGDLTEILAETDCPFNRGAGGEGDDESDNGRPDWAGEGKPEWAGAPGGPNASADTDSDDDGKGRPDWAGTPGGPKDGNDD